MIIAAEPRALVLGVELGDADRKFTWPRRTPAQCPASAKPGALASGDNKQSEKARGQIEFGQV
jgi:hypothetical protein